MDAFAVSVTDGLTYVDINKKTFFIAGTFGVHWQPKRRHIAGNISFIQNMDDDILLEEETYYIRKKKFVLHYGIYIN